MALRGREGGGRHCRRLLTRGKVRVSWLRREVVRQPFSARDAGHAWRLTRRDGRLSRRGWRRRVDAQSIASRTALTGPVRSQSSRGFACWRSRRGSVCHPAQNDLLSSGAVPALPPDRRRPQRQVALSVHRVGRHSRRIGIRSLTGQVRRGSRVSRGRSRRLRRATHLHSVRRGRTRDRR